MFHTPKRSKKARVLYIGLANVRSEEKVQLNQPAQTDFAGLWQPDGTEPPLATAAGWRQQRLVAASSPASSANRSKARPSRGERAFVPCASVLTKCTSPCSTNDSENR